MKKNGHKFLFLILLITMFPITVKAENVQFSLCFNDKGAYSIIYDSGVATEVDKEKEKINYDAAVAGHLPYPENATDADKTKYQFTAVKISSSCSYDADKNIKTCPTGTQLDKYDIIGEYITKNNDDLPTNDTITFDFQELTGKFTVNIKDAYNDELYVRNSASNISDEKNASNFTGQFLTRSSGKYVISNVSANTEVTLEFYIKKEGDCNGDYLGYISFYTPSTDNYYIDNPAYNSTTSDVYNCKSVNDYKPSGMSSEDDETFDRLKKSYISECYVNTRIKYNDKATLASRILEKLNNLKAMFTNYSTTEDKGSRICSNEYQSNQKITYSETRTYWGIVCTEKYTAKGDNPKLVKAGDGFDYTTTYTVERTCNIMQISKPTKRPKCTYSISHTCSWKTGSGNDAGPNNIFDNCINDCDGGKYTQECINSCYASIYKNNRDISFLEQFSSSSKKSTVEFVATYTSPPAEGESCTTDHGRPGKIIRHCIAGSDPQVCDQACFSTWCGKNGGKCVFTESVTPANCVNDPDTEYNKLLNDSQNELSRMEGIQKQEISSGNYIYEIRDSYLKDDSGNYYVFTVKSKDNPKVNISTKTSTTKESGVAEYPKRETKTGVALGNSGGGITVNYDSSRTDKAIFTVSLPLSYVNKTTGDAVYVTSESSKNGYKIVFDKNLKKYKLASFTGFNPKKYYHESGERKYYTNIWSDNLNVTYPADGIVALAETTDYNITVTSSSVGGGSWGSDNKCYYGVYNNIPIVCPKDDPNCCDPKKDICDGGIHYIYRPIDLTDMFPNGRDPRWNWTGTVDPATNIATGAAQTQEKSFYDDAVDPTKLIENIQSKGESIYDVKSDSSEIDYEFVLTRENIINIRNYNKNIRDYNGDGKNNYLDYNMECYNDGTRDICVSRFLDNINGNNGSEESASFITYSVNGYGITERKSIAGCNNAVDGTACDYIGK